MLGHSSKPLSHTLDRHVHRDCLCLALGLSVALTKFLLLFIFSLEETTV